MSPCNGFLPTHQAQLEYRWGGLYGRSNCTACAGGEAGQSDTCGLLLFTGAQIRAATNEPTPDPQSPGLNLSQVDSALRSLSHGVIDLDTRYAIPFDTYRAKLTAGSQAILQLQRIELIRAGQGYGNAFPGGHAVASGADNGVPWFDDPLTGRHVTTWATLEKAAGALLFPNGTHLGFGKVYAAFTRDITQAYRVTIRPIPPETRRSWVEYIVKDGRIQTSVLRSTRGFAAACTPPANLLTTSGARRVSLVRITAGGYAGRWCSSKWSD